MSFNFRQRAGCIDWHSISSLDIDEIVTKVRIRELQSMVDVVTFCEVVPKDIKINTIETTLKLVHLMQLIIEYLLYHQEGQFKVIRKQNKRMAHLKSENHLQEQQLVSIKEDIRTYQRQLHILRKTLNASSSPGAVDKEILLRLLQNPPKIIRPLQDNSAYLSGINAPSTMDAVNQAQVDSSSTILSKGNNNERHSDLVKVILDHEQQGRIMMSAILEEQRRAFKDEMSVIAAAVSKVSPNLPTNALSSISEREQHFQSQLQQQQQTMTLFMENMRLSLESVVQKILESLKENQNNPQLRSSRPVTSSRPNEPNSSQDVESILKMAAMDSVEKDLASREKNLFVKESELKKREDSLSYKQREFLAHQQDINAKSQSSLETVDTSLIKKKAAKLIFLRCSNVIKRRVNRPFRHWFRVMIELRTRDMSDEHAKQLVYATEKKSEQELSLLKQLNDEKEKLLVSSSRLNSLQRQLDSTLQRMRDIEATKELDEDMKKKLQSEKEKNIVLSSKYNTLLKTAEEEKSNLLSRLQLAETVIAKSHASAAKSSASDSNMEERKPRFLRETEDASVGVGSSLSFPLASSRPSQRNRLPETLRGQISEDILFKRAQTKIAERNNKEEIQKLAMASLTQEFLSKL